MMKKLLLILALLTIAAPVQAAQNNLAPSSTVSLLNPSQVQADSYSHTGIYGYTAFGDSITYGVGATTSANAYAYLIASDLNTTLTNLGIAGNRACDVSYSAVYNTNPSNAGNPIYSISDGTNDAGSSSTIYNKCIYGAATWLGLSSTNKVLASVSAVSKSGTWSSDTTFANATGEASTSSGNTLSYSANVGKNGVFYVLYRMLNSSDSTFTVQVDGLLANDTIGNSTTIHTQNTVGTVNEPSGVGVARFLTTNGSHTILITSGSGNLTILALEFPPNTRYRGLNAPGVIFTGIIPQQNYANNSSVLAQNALNLQASLGLTADGIWAPFADINNAVDGYLDMSSSATQNCPASTSAGLHPNDCGHRHIAQTIESVMGASTQIIKGTLGGPYTMAGPLQMTNTSAMSSVSQFPSILGYKYTDSLLSGLNINTSDFGSYIGIKAMQSTTGFGSYGLALYATDTSKIMGDCWSSTSNPTADSQFTCPITFTSAGQITAASLNITGTTSTTLPGPLYINTGAAVSNFNSFTSFNPHSYLDTLIGGIQFCNGAGCGLKQYSGPRGYGSGLFNTNSNEIGIGFATTGNPTSESQFNWPIWFTSDGTLHGTASSFTGTAASTSSGVGFGGTTAAASNCNSGGTVTGVAGCLIINVNGTTHYTPYY